MSKIEIVNKGITRFTTDAIVNAANAQLQAGGGVCGVIFKYAGYSELTAACDAIGYCPTGSAVITPGFNLKAKYIIHAVGPVWEGGNSGEPQKLYGCYKKSLEIAKQNKCHSIAFPLISSGIFGYPKDKAWRKALQACLDFIDENKDYDIDIYFAVLDDSAKSLGEKTLAVLSKKDSPKNRVEKKPGLQIEEKQKLFCLKYFSLLQTIDWEDELKGWCRKHSPYFENSPHPGVLKMLYQMESDAYSSNMVIHNYMEIIENTGIDQKKMYESSTEFINTLDKAQLLACIAWHFRQEHFIMGYLISDAVAKGKLLKYMKALMRDEHIMLEVRDNIKSDVQPVNKKAGIIYTKLTKKAMQIAYRQHAGQPDKAGLPYIFHPYHLAEQMGSDENAICVALLHDVAEDTEMTIDEIAVEGFPDEVIIALRLLKHEKGVPYREYIKKIKPNPLAKKVKLADLYHNSDATRLPEPKNDIEKMQNEKRIHKYSQAIAFLEDR